MSGVIAAVAVASIGTAVFMSEEQKKAARHQEHLNRVAAAKQEAELNEQKANEEKTSLRNKQLADIRRRSGLRGFGAASSTQQDGGTLIGGGSGNTLLGA